MAEPAKATDVFLIDRSIPKQIGKALALVRPFGEVEVHDDRFPPRTKDPDLFQQLGQRGWCWVARDNQVRRRRREMQAIIDAELRAFYLVNAQELRIWETFEILVRRWTDIIDYATTMPGPYLVGVKRAGRLEEIALKGVIPPGS